MKIAFISPSPAVLKHDWYRDLPYQKVGVPNLAGYLKRAGFPDIVQYDFNNQVRAAYEKRPHSVKLLLYDDGAAVRRFLRSDEPAIRKQTEFLLDALGVGRADLFGLSLSHFIGDEREIKLGANLVKCLAKILRERFPGAVIALGGLQNMSTAALRSDCRALLRACPALDYAVAGEAHKALLRICRAAEKGEALTKRDLKGFYSEKVNGNLLLQELETGKGDPGPRYFRPLPAEEVRDPSVPYGFPAYDKANSAAHSWTGEQVRRWYHLPEALKKELKRGTPDNYLVLNVSFTEGCPFNCFFCASARSGVFTLDIDASIDMLRRFKDELGCRHFLFYDHNFNPTPAYARTFLEKLIKADLGLLWADCFNLRNMDRELIAMMREAGVMKVVTGVEYPTKRMLKYVNKGLTLEKIYRNLEDLHKAGIWNHALLITGLPTETWDDVKELEDWLKATKDFVNSYTIASFHMAEDSPFHREPEKFGFTLKEAIRLYRHAAFDEKGGLAWGEKERRSADTNAHIRRFIDELRKSPKASSAKMDDSHLLMYLYRTLGHGNKNKIEELYEAAYTINPHIAPSYGLLGAQLARPGSRLNALLRRGGLEMRLGSCSHETYSFSLQKGGAAADCQVQARSEDILLNPAEGRVHGDHFVLQARLPAPPASRAAELAGILRAIGGKLKADNAAAPARGSSALTLTAGTGTVRLIISSRRGAPSFRHKTLSGHIDSVVLDRIGRLISGSAADAGERAAKTGKAAIKAGLPEILGIAESWR